jgi:hypothetical protein
MNDETNTAAEQAPTQPGYDPAAPAPPKIRGVIETTILEGGLIMTKLSIQPGVSKSELVGAMEFAKHGIITKKDPDFVTPQNGDVPKEGVDL